MPTDPSKEPSPPGPKKPDSAADWTRVLREAAPYLGIGTSSALTVLIGLGAGHALDGKLGTEPLFFLLGGVFGVLAAFWQVYKLAMNRKP